MALVERMQTRMIGLVNAYIDRLMRALEPELRARFLHQDARGKKPPKPPAAPPSASGIPETVFETGEVAISQAFLRSIFHAIDSTAAADLQRVIPVPLERVLPNSHKLEQEWLRTNTDLIKLEERARREVEQIITDPLRQGERVEVIREKIQERLGVVRSRAELIARDQTLKAYGQIQEARQRAAGITQYVWSTSEDERVRPDHQDLDGTTQSWDSPPVVDKRTGRREHPGLDYQCLPGNAEVLLANPVLRLWRNRYRGQLTTLVTHTGETLECTPNHLILTASGWQPAERLQVGDYIFQAGQGSIQLAKAYVQDGVPGISEVFKAHRLAFGLGRPSAVASQLQGYDVIDHQVHVVDMHSSLRPDLEAAFRQRLREFRFTDPEPPAFALRQAELVLQGQWLAPHRSIRSLRLRLAQHFVSVREAGEIGGASSADLDAFTLEQLAHGRALYAEPLGQLFDRRAIGVQAQALILREWLGVVRRSVMVDAVGKASSQGFFMHADDIRNPSPRQAFGAHETRVVQKSVRQFEGHTYNFSTQGEWYIAQNLIVHNCRCAAVPVLPDDLEDAT